MGRKSAYRTVGQAGWRRDGLSLRFHFAAFLLDPTRSLLPVRGAEILVLVKIGLSNAPAYTIAVLAVSVVAAERRRVSMMGYSAGGV